MRSPSKHITWILLLLIAVMLACSMPGITQRSTQAPPDVGEVKATAEKATLEPAPSPVLTATPPALPPALVEVDPLPGSILPLQATFRFYFNQPMDKPSVELALHGQPALSGRFTWVDDATVVFESDAALLPGSDLSITFSTSALAKNGLFLQKPIVLSYKTASPLSVTQLLPEPDAREVDPTSAIVAIFNQPVVSLEADPGTHPQALILTPAVPGHGEWANSSTYIFYPEPAMVGGTIYTVLLNPRLTNAAGVPFEGRKVFDVNAFEWSFETALPRLVSISPGDGAAAVSLDTVFQVHFSQPMDQGSVEENFSIYDLEQNEVTGIFGWDEYFTTLTFTPTNLLARDTDYTLALLGSSRASGGTSLGYDSTSRFKTVPAFRILETQPENQGIKQGPSNLSIRFSNPAEETGDPLQFISISPDIRNLDYWWGDFNRTLNIQGDFQPLSTYTVTVSDLLPDYWGATIGEPYTLTFETAALEPAIFIAHGAPALTLRPQESTVTAQVTQVDRIEMRLGSVPLNDLIKINAPGSYDLYKNYLPTDQRTWLYKAGVPGDKYYTVQLPISPKGQALQPGIYLLDINAFELASQPPPYLLVSSNIQLSLKLSPTSAFVWAVDLRTMEPAGGVPVAVYDSAGVQLASGPTDSQGVFQAPIPTQPDLYSMYYAVSSEPGGEFFSLCLSTWNQGIDSGDFGFSSDFTAPDNTVYLYTDRSIYQPGQNVNFRGVVRYAHNGRYALPGIDTAAVTIYDEDYQAIQQTELDISEFGTIHGTYALPESAQPGRYVLTTLDSSVSFDVAIYQKPEISLTLHTPGGVVAGEVIEAQIDARYSNNSLARNIPVSWQVYRTPATFTLPGYQTGPDPYPWLSPSWQDSTDSLGETVLSGEARTDSNGQLTIRFPGENQPGMPYRYTLEALRSNESATSARSHAELMVHPADFYIGLRPNTWVGQAGTEISFEVLTVDWMNAAVGEKELIARFREVSWSRSESPDPFDYPAFSPNYSPVSSADLVTGPDGAARLAFTPPRAGVYQLEVSGSGAQSSILIWAGGAEQVQWPDLPNSQLKLTPDKEGYLPGDTAAIFIPNPFQGTAQVLVAVERDEVLRYEVFTLADSGISYPLTLLERDTPNVYFSVTLIGMDESGRPDFRSGYLNLEVEPTDKVLTIDLSLSGTEGDEEPELQPGEEVSLSVQVRDTAGRPVRSEFSLKVVNQAGERWETPDTVDILTAFYGVQPLGVRNGISLAADAQRRTWIQDSVGDEGEEAPNTILSQDLPEPAFWQADITTDANGEADLTLTLPDDLDAWQVEIRSVSADTLTGQFREVWRSSKKLLVQPVAPLFLVAGDQTRLAAVVHNRSEMDLQVDVNLQGSGFTLDLPNQQTQRVSIRAGASTLVTWTGRVEEIASLDLVFSASGGGHQDTAVPSTSSIPVHQNNMPQTYYTAGILDLEGEHLEVFSLPPNDTPTAGTMDIQLAPSLAAVMAESLDLLADLPYGSSEEILASFLPNLIAYRTIQDLGLESSQLAARLDRTLEEGIKSLTSRQNEDGGWKWWPQARLIPAEGFPTQTSDPYLSAYIFFGLNQAQQTGVFIEDALLQKGRSYLLATLPALEMLSSTWQLDRLAFHYLALARSGESISDTAKDLFEVRDQLSPYAEAFLALTLGYEDPKDSRIEPILIDLQGSAIQSGTGVHWQGKNFPANLDTPLFNTAVVVYTLAQYDPASQLIPEALRYLVSQRKADGSWGSSYETTWTLLALIEVMKGTGELAGDFDFSASINGKTIIEGQAGGDRRLNPVSASVPMEALVADAANSLSLQRSAGPGRLYYTAHLNLNQTAATVDAQSCGIHISRTYQSAADGTNAVVGDRVTVRVAVTLENDAHYLIVEDFIPAGAEILDTTLQAKSAALGGCGESGANCYQPQAPFAAGWGWWWFEEPLIFDDHITWAADYIPAGTYEFTYTIAVTLAGEYQVLPAHAWQVYLPEVFGRSGGDIFKIND